MNKKGRQAFHIFNCRQKIYFLPFLLGACDKTDPASFLEVDDEAGLLKTLLASFAIFFDVCPDLAIKRI